MHFLSFPIYLYSMPRIKKERGDHTVEADKKLVITEILIDFSIRKKSRRSSEMSKKSRF